MIDVVIVAKNEERHIGAVLSAIAAQKNVTGIKTFVVDNGSSDNTVEIAQKHNARIIECTGSLGKARNRGIACGDNALVAFLDAHSVPIETWGATLAKAFSEQTDLGAAMGSIENISERPGTELLAKHSMFSSPERLWKNTISGLNSPLPWIPTGNCMYSRDALNQVEGFDENLFRCEDTDLSWKIVLQGYQLAYVPEAKATHYDRAGGTSYLRKYYNYGAGAAELACKYGLEASPAAGKNLSGTKFLLDACYKLGFYSRRKTAMSPKITNQVNQKFRQKFPWHNGTEIGLSSRMIYWFVKGSTCICVNLETNSRLVLEDLSADIFHLLTRQCNRSEIIEAISQQFDIDKEAIASDLDELIQQLIDNQILSANQHSPNHSESHFSK